MEMLHKAPAAKVTPPGPSDQSAVIVMEVENDSPAIRIGDDDAIGLEPENITARIPSCMPVTRCKRQSRWSPKELELLHEIVRLGAGKSVKVLYDMYTVKMH